MQVRVEGALSVAFHYTPSKGMVHSNPVLSSAACFLMVGHLGGMLCPCEERNPHKLVAVGARGWCLHCEAPGFLGVSHPSAANNCVTLESSAL